MSILKQNIAANFCGNAWTGLMSLVFVPLYIRFLGIESYGLIGVFVTLQSVLGLLDLGLSATITREMARLSVLPGKHREMRDLVRTLEVVYWSVALLIGITIVLISPLLAHHWLNAGQVPVRTIDQALCIMGLAAALQWPSAFYSGGLMGLQKQVILNAINMAMSTVRGAGAVFIVWLISPTIQAFFTWQIITSSINTLLLAVFLWRRLPRCDERPVFKKSVFAGIWRFAAGTSGSSVLATILTQLDKIILSRMLTLEMFGYYTLASVVAMSLYRLSSPIYSAIYPRLTQLVSIVDQNGVTQLYHQGSQLMAVVVLPITIVIAIFSQEILLIWTQDPTTAANAHCLVSILICGTALNIMCHTPYALQLANGKTRMAVVGNLIAMILLVPMIVHMTDRYGATGAATVWVILNIGYFAIATPIVHRYLLPHENWHWYVQDVGVPMLAVTAAALLGRLLIPAPLSKGMAIGYLSAISMFTLLVASMATATTRTWLASNLRSLRRTKRHPLNQDRRMEQLPIFELLPLQPLVSVGIPTYNRPDMLKFALGCVTAQTYPNLEIIVSDNASPGNATEQVVRSFAQHDSRIKYFRQGTGIGSNPNFKFVLEEAKGSLFMWLADDDGCDETFVADLVECFHHDPAIVLAMSDVRFKDTRSDMSVEHLSSIRLQHAVRNWEAVRRIFFAYPTSNIFHCLYGLYRTDILKRCGINYASRWKGITFASEVPILAQIASHGKIVSVPKVLKTYVSHPDSEYVKERVILNRFDRMIRHMEIRMMLTWIAMRSSLKLREKMPLAIQPWVPWTQKEEIT